VLIRIKHVVQHNAPARLVNVDREWLHLCLGLQYLSLLGDGRRLVGSGKLSHQCITAVVVKVDPRYVGIVESTGATCLVVVPGAGPVEVGRLLAAAAGTRECGAWERLILARKSLQKIGSTLGGELIVSKANA